MGPTIQLGYYMGHLRHCLIGRDAQCHTHYHPGSIVHYLGTGGQYINHSVNHQDNIKVPVQLTPTKIIQSL